MRKLGRWITGLLWAGPLLAGSLVSHQVHQNRIDIEVSDGAAVVEWINDSTFRFCRTWISGVPCGIPRNTTSVTYEVKDAGSQIEMRSKYLVVRMNKADLRLEVRTASYNTFLYGEPEPMQPAGSSVIHLGRVSEGENLWGLNARFDRKVDLRGRTVQSRQPLLVSSNGYGLFYTPPGEYRFDLGAAQADRFRAEIPGNIAGYYFYYGPKMKDVFEQHGEAFPTAEGDPKFESENDWIPRFAEALPTTASPCDALGGLLSSAFSGYRVPALDAGALLAGEGASRSQQVLTLAPFLYRFPAKSPAGQQMLRTRERWHLYLGTYLQETRDRGYPMIHPLPMQFPEDPAMNVLPDQFMLGDEVLLAPSCTGSAQRELYLPRGIWTDLRTNQEFRGKQKLKTDAATLPIFARNGTILPLASESDPSRLELHYFPKLGAEFFLIEPEVEEVTQYHASPALDFLRLEAESKKDRECEWVVHHWTPVKTVQHNGKSYQEVSSPAALVAGTYFYDAAQKNLHIRLKTTAGADDIVNVTY